MFMRLRLSISDSRIARIGKFSTNERTHAGSVSCDSATCPISGITSRSRASTVCVAAPSPPGFAIDSAMIWAAAKSASPGFDPVSACAMRSRSNAIVNASCRFWRRRTDASPPAPPSGADTMNAIAKSYIRFGAWFCATFRNDIGSPVCSDHAQPPSSVQS